MKTTLDLPDELLIAAKKKAAEQRRPLRALVEEGLRIVLEASKRPDRKRTVTLVTATLITPTVMLCGIRATMVRPK